MDVSLDESFDDVDDDDDVVVVSVSVFDDCSFVSFSVFIDDSSSSFSPSFLVIDDNDDDDDASVSVFDDSSFVSFSVFMDGSSPSPSSFSFEGFCVSWDFLDVPSFSVFEDTVSVVSLSESRDARSSFSHSMSCPINPPFGLTTDLLFVTYSMASLNPSLSFHITYAITNVADLDIPAWQCTSTASVAEGGFGVSSQSTTSRNSDLKSSLAPSSNKSIVKYAYLSGNASTHTASARLSTRRIFSRANSSAFCDPASPVR